MIPGAPKGNAMSISSRPLSDFERTKLADFLFASPVIAWYCYAVARDYEPFAGLIWRVMVGAGTFAIYANLAARIASFAFAFLVIAFLILRAPPVGKTRGALPKLVAVLGAFLGIAFLGLPVAVIPPWLSIFSAFLIVAGSLYAIYALSFLGRSFSVLPEARRLVTAGPFGWMRHPVYFGEEVALIGIMLQFKQPWSLLLILVQFAFQIGRMIYEERILGEVFPDYTSYKARTARLIPGLY